MHMLWLLSSKFRLETRQQLLILSLKDGYSLYVFVHVILIQMTEKMTCLLIQILRWLMQAKVWRFVGLGSSVVGLLCYALSSSFNHLFGNWTLLKTFLYGVFSFIICLLILYAKIWQHSRSLRFKAHIAFFVLTITSVYSFFVDKVMSGKPDAYSLISYAAFAIMSLSLSRQTQCGFEVDLLYFFLGCLIVQLMKIKLPLVIVGVGYSYCLIILRSSFSSIDSAAAAGIGYSQGDENSVVIEVDSHSPKPPCTTDIASMMEQLRTCVKVYSEMKVLPLETTINDIQVIAKRMVDCGFEEVCSNVYSNCRKEFLEETLSGFRLQKLYIENVHKMPWLKLEDEIKRWSKASNAALKILFPTERRLCDRVFLGFSSSSVADFSFYEVCKGSTIHLLNFANAVAIGSGSPQRLFRIIDVFETMRDLIPEFESLFRDKYSSWLSNQATAIWNRLGEAIRGVFMELEYLIRRDLEQVREAKVDEFPGCGGLDPNTRYVVNYLRAACRSQRTLEQVFEDYGRLFKEYSVPSSPPLSRKMNWIMELLESSLEAKSKMYEDDALCYGFLMSNGRYLIKMTKDSELGALLGDGWIREHTEKVRNYHVQYQRNSWDRLLGILNLESVGGSVLMKEKLKSFNMVFEEICRVQSSWFEVIDGQLREEIRTSVLKSLMPAYRNFIGRFQSVPELGKHADKYVKYGTWDLKVRLNALFQGSSGLTSRRRRPDLLVAYRAYGIGVGTAQSIGVSNIGSNVR